MWQARPPSSSALCVAAQADRHIADIGGCARRIGSGERSACRNPPLRRRVPGGSLVVDLQEPGERCRLVRGHAGVDQGLKGSRSPA